MLNVKLSTQMHFGHIKSLRKQHVYWEAANEAKYEKNKSTIKTQNTMNSETCREIYTVHALLIFSWSDTCWELMIIMKGWYFLVLLWKCVSSGCQCHLVKKVDTHIMQPPPTPLNWHNLDTPGRVAYIVFAIWAIHIVVAVVAYSWRMHEIIK